MTSPLPKKSNKKNEVVKEAPQPATEAPSSYGRQPPDKTEFRYLVYLSRKYHMPLEELKDARDIFQTFDRGCDGSGEIPHEQLKLAMREFCNLPEDLPVPWHLMKAVIAQDTDHSGTMCFEEFLLWYMTTAYTEEMMVSSIDERRIRQLARERKMLLLDVERIKKVFDHFDEDGSGEIEQVEFREILCSLMNIKNQADVSEQRLLRYWRELDSDLSGAVTFDEFLDWYVKSGIPSGP